MGAIYITGFIVMAIIGVGCLFAGYKNAVKDGTD